MRFLWIWLLAAPIDWTRVDRELALARERTDLEIILKQTRAEFEATHTPPSAELFGLIIACKRGGISPRGESHLASGYRCVGKDASDAHFNVDSITVFDEGLSPGP